MFWNLLLPEEYSWYEIYLYRALQRRFVSSERLCVSHKPRPPPPPVTLGKNGLVFTPRSSRNNGGGSPGTGEKGPKPRCQRNLSEAPGADGTDSGIREKYACNNDRKSARIKRLSGPKRNLVSDNECNHRIRQGFR